MTELVSGLRWNALNTLIGQGAGLGRLLLVAAATGPEIAGKFAIASSIVGGAAILTEIGFRQQFISTPLATDDVLTHRKLSVAWTLNFSLRILVTGIVLLLITANQIVSFASTDTLLAALGLALAHLLNATANPKLLEKERLGDFRANMLCESGGQVFGLALVLALLSHHASLELLVLSQVAASGCMAATSYIFVPRHRMARFAVQDLINMAQHGRSFMIIATMTYATYSLDKLVLGWLADAQSVGSYYMAQRVAEIPAFAFSAIVGRTALPAYLKAEHKGDGAVFNAIRNYTWLLFSLALPCYFATLAILHSSWLSGMIPNWADARTLLSLLLVAAIFRLGCHLMAPAMIIRNDVATDARFKTQEAVIFVPLLALTTWHLGAIGAAICAIGLYVFSWWRRYRFVRRYKYELSPGLP